MPELVTIKCPRCKHTAGQVIHAAQYKRRGWYCVKCNHFEKAIGRELILDPDAELKPGPVHQANTER